MYLCESYRTPHSHHALIAPFLITFLPRCVRTAPSQRKPLAPGHRKAQVKKFSVRCWSLLPGPIKAFHWRTGAIGNSAFRAIPKKIKTTVAGTSCCQDSAK